MANYLLVSFKTCPWVQRAAIVLREKRIEFEFRHIDPDNRPDWFLAISPHRKVPVLRVDDRVSLFESNAIAEYLDETIAPRLHPEDPLERANLKDRRKDVYDRLVTKWLEWNQTMLPEVDESATGAFTGDQLADHIGARPATRTADNPGPPPAR